MRSLILAISLFLFGNASSFANSDWTQQDFAVAVSLAQKSTESLSGDVNESSINVNASLVQLYEGIGVKADLTLFNSFYSGNTLQNTEKMGDYAVVAQSRLFISPTVNIDVAVSQSQRVEVNDIGASRFNRISESLLEHQQKAQWLAVNIGSEQKSRELVLTLQNSSGQQDLYYSEQRYRRDEHLTAQLEYADQISEDSYFLAKVSRTDSSNDFTATVMGEALREVTYSNLYLGFRTSYLGNSELSVLLGNSHQFSMMADASRDIFSWQINNQLNLSEDFELNLSTFRQFSDSPDPEFNSVELTSHQIRLNSQISEFWAANTALNLKEHIFTSSEALNTDANLELSELSIHQSINWQVVDYFTLSAGVSYADYDGTSLVGQKDTLNWQLSGTWEWL